MFRRQGVDAKAVPMSEAADRNLESLPFISVLKLAGIVAAGITPPLVALFLIVNANIRAAQQDALERAAAVFVHKEVYAIEHAAVVARVAEHAKRAETNEERLDKIDMQLQRLLAAADAIRAEQLQQRERMRR